MYFSENGRTFQGVCQVFLEKKYRKMLQLFWNPMGTQKGKCYRKTEVKLKFWRRKKPVKKRLGSFRDYTKNKGGVPAEA